MVKRALIVDDFPLDAELTRRVLETCNEVPEIVIASDGEEALHELEKTPNFDVILLDLRLPKVDGFDVLKTISSKPSLSEIPVVVVSSNQNDYDRTRVLLMGAKDFVEKSIDYSEFRLNLSRQLAKHNLCCTRFYPRLTPNHRG